MCSQTLDSTLALCVSTTANTEMNGWQKYKDTFYLCMQDRAGGGVQSPRAPPALAEDLDLVLSTFLHNSSSRGSDALFWPPWTPGRHGTYTYMWAKPLIHIKQKKWRSGKKSERVLLFCSLCPWELGSSVRTDWATVISGEWGFTAIPKTDYRKRVLGWKA